MKLSLKNLGLMAVAGACTSVCADAVRPNVIFVIADDQGYGDLGCHGNPKLKTPNLDTLYKQSVRLTDYHVSPTCTPSRAALMTGRFSNRTGAWHTINGRSILRENETAMPRFFKNNGYRTAMFGKWHLGDNYPARPEDKGFAEVYRHGGGGIGQTPDYWDNTYFDGSFLHNGQLESFDGFCTDVFFDRAMEFMKEQAKPSSPVFVYLSLNAAHSPLHCPESFSAPYADLGERMANFFGMIANIDWNMGRLDRFLKKTGLEENTILVYTTDNGSSFGWNSYNARMKGGKGSQYDGGHRVPFFIRWPAGGISGGRDVDDLTAHIDVLPTLLDLTGLPAAGGLPVDGVSLAPLLFGITNNGLERVLITDSQRQYMPEKWRKSAVMTERWRLIDGRKLYDIQADPEQETDRSADFPEIVKNLRVAYEKSWNSMEDSFADECEIILGNDAENPARLTAHDWILNEGNAPWNQKLIRQQASVREGSWSVRIEKAGRYRIRLFRWPPEAGCPIAADLAPGQDVPGEAAYRITPGQGFPATRARLEIAGKQLEFDVSSADCFAEFTLNLPAIDTRLKGTFLGPDGTRLGGYYAVVERL